MTQRKTKIMSWFELLNGWKIDQQGTEDSIGKCSNEFRYSLAGGEKQFRNNQNNLSLSGQEEQVCIGLHSF